MPHGRRWLGRQKAKGHFNGPDRMNAEQLNRYDWYSAHDWQVAYPGDREDLPARPGAGTQATGELHRRLTR